MNHCLRQILCTGMIALGIATMNAYMRERCSMDEGWEFAFGDASSPERDFGCGTEYFTYLTKAASIHNEGPYSPKFNPDSSGRVWTRVDLPHDWVVDLPFAAEASHSHGYKTVGYKYPETSVGWYRKTFAVPAEDQGRHMRLTLEGAFRDAQLWVNGFYLGGEPSGYAEQVYDITDYLNYGGDNLLTVRCDASVEEGWFYEGAGIYRDVWLEKLDPVHVAEHGVWVTPTLSDDMRYATLVINTEVDNRSHGSVDYRLRHTVYDGDGRVVAQGEAWPDRALKASERGVNECVLGIEEPVLWDLDNPYMYAVVTEVIAGEDTTDSHFSRFGIRKAEFDPDKGFLLNGKSVKLKGVNMHQDHAGVGAAIPDGLHVYRLKQLKDYGVNAYRSSHNPASRAVLDACDTLGILVIDENRLTGINDYHIGQLERMIRRDRQHPSVILYSVGNEEWGIEWNDFGERIVRTMRDHCHRLDSTRPMTVASSSGPTVLVPADVAGYNYILQNPVEEHRAAYPQRCAVGTEETSGCGTRGVYYDDRENGRMAALNRSPNGPDSLLNCIERGWKFYDERPWLGGLFYWTGFDYRGEPNPLVFPATGSEFGIFDYCGFPKDEAWYLKSWWTDTPVLHLLPHWNLAGHEGETVDVWAYSNCDEVELRVNGKRLGRKAMPRDGHLSWQAVYQPGYIEAIGYKDGKKVITERVATSGAPARLDVQSVRSLGCANGREVAVYNVRVLDAKGRFVPDACVPVTIEVDPSTRILGAGNGDPAFRGVERSPERGARTFTMTTFNGMAQFIVDNEWGKTASDDTFVNISLDISDNN